ncbi:MAG: glutamine-hydrolyzing carbamoyl-phosphate synthase small subunit [Bacillota bacterium]|nr:glutamine-hydrolyzing carbamoyl-phosphate synthase small subunit [Bacillota bacterium]
MRPGLLVLEDGAAFPVYLVGAEGEAEGEVVFNTSMVGYQEILTDPSYAGQIVTLTYPLIGNYGASPEACESRRPWGAGLIVHDLCRAPNHWRSREDLEAFLRRHGLVALTGVDTRALTRHLRTRGTMRGIITGRVDAPRAELTRRAGQVPPISGRDLISQVTVPAPRCVGTGRPVVVVDLGVKERIVQAVVSRGFQAVVVPARTGAEEILSYSPAGVIFSNGPGDPVDAPYAAETVRQLLGRLPVLGICLGHQILALALGGQTYKLKFGHRGGNQPVQDRRTGRVYITSQNHSFAVRAESLDPEEVEVTHVNVNDGTVEGLAHRRYPAFSVQFHPEAAPGPRDTGYLFDQFCALL